MRSAESFLEFPSLLIFCVIIDWILQNSQMSRIILSLGNNRLLVNDAKKIQ